MGKTLLCQDRDVMGVQAGKMATEYPNCKCKLLAHAYNGSRRR